MDHYPMKENTPYSGTGLQAALDSLTDVLDTCRRRTLEDSLDLYFTSQAHQWCDGLNDCPQRDPTRSEIRCMTNLGLAYGVDGILYYRYPSTYIADPGYYRCRGLVDYDKTPFDKWYMVKDTIRPYIEKIGPVIGGLDWQGACRGDELWHFWLRNLTRSYLEDGDELCQYGFFTDPQGLPDSNYLMIVSRDCSADSVHSCSTAFDLDDTITWDSLNIYNLYSDNIEGQVTHRTYPHADNVFSPLMEPGEGKLFKLIKFVQEGHISTNTVWGGKIYVRDTVFVDPGITLRILPRTSVRFYESKPLIVRGTLEALASSEIDVIDFIPRSWTDTSGCWPGIVVEQGGRIKMRYAHVEKADVGLTLNEPVGDTVSYSRFYRNYSCGIKVVNSDNVRILYNTVDKDSASTIPAEYGIYIRDITSGASCAAGNTVKFYKNGIYVRNCSTLLVNNKIYVGNVGIKAEDCAYVYMGNTYVTGKFDSCYVHSKSSKTFINVSQLTGGSSSTPYGIIYEDDKGSKLRETEIFGWIDSGHIAVCDKSADDPPDLGTVDEEGNNWFEHLDSNITAYYVWTNMGGRGGFGPLGPGGPPQVPEDSLKAEKNYWGDTIVYPHHFHGNVDYIPWLDSLPGWTPQYRPFSPNLVTQSDLPKDFRLSQNYPNPFNPHTLIEYDLPEEARVKIKIYNILGQRVITLVDEEKPAGRYQVSWNGRDEKGEQVSTGIYFYRIKAGGFQGTKKLLLIR